jgi:hypothetical protein
MGLKKKWEVEVDGACHVVELRNSFWLALLIYVDGTLVHRARGIPLVQVVGDFAFPIGSQEAVLCVRDLRTFVDYMLSINGKSVGEYQV